MLSFISHRLKQFRLKAIVPQLVAVSMLELPSSSACKILMLAAALLTQQGSQNREVTILGNRRVYTITIITDPLGSRIELLVDVAVDLPSLGQLAD